MRTFAPCYSKLTNGCQFHNGLINISINTSYVYLVLSLAFDYMSACYEMYFPWVLQTFSLFKVGKLLSTEVVITGNRVTWGKSSFTEISVFESLSWHSCDMDLKVLWLPLCLHSLVIRCKKYINNDINLNFQSFNVIFEDSGNKFALWITMFIKYIAWGMKIHSLVYT